MIPKTIEEAVEKITNFYEFCEMADSHTMEEFSSKFHSSIGRYIRNEWNLWKGFQTTDDYTDCELFHELIDYGLMHADDMATVLMELAWSKHHGKEYDIRAKSNQFLEFWSKYDESDILFV